MANIQFQLRRGLASLWNSVNPTLAQGEMGVETDTNKIKIGNGLSGWTSLAYVAGEAGGITGSYVTTFNGLTGAVTGVCASVGNTFIGTQCFQTSLVTIPPVVIDNGIIKVANYAIATGNIDDQSRQNIIFGTIPASLSSADLFNILIGAGAGSGICGGLYNTAIGFGALEAGVTPEYNVAIGANALKYITTGGPNNNIAIGYNAGSKRGAAGFNLTDASSSIFLGNDARAAANGQSNQIVIGYGAIGLGSNSTVIGTNGTTFARIYGVLDLPSGLSASGATFSTNGVGIPPVVIDNGIIKVANYAIATGNIDDQSRQNIIFGTIPASLSSADLFNILIGAGAGSGICGGLYNTVVGFNALADGINPEYNVAIGANALRYITTGGPNNNIGIGYNAGSKRGSAGFNLTDASSSIFIGFDTRAGNNGQSNQIVIGNDARGLGSNSTVIGTNGTTFARIYGLLDLQSGLSASGATFSNTVNLNSNTLYKPTLQYYNEPTSSPGISGNTLSLDLSLAQVFNVSLNAGISSFIVTNVPQTESRAIGFSLFLTADGTARGISWGSAVKWPSGIPPTLTTTNNKTDILSFTTLDGGTSYFGSVAGQNY